ncbi:MAG: hypothetical protein E6507_08500 [Prevotella bivia]|uniref:hypothetical protein n=1 Tax=uncultured Prevotella sp. TaxID=159272 RepID=UPI0028043550|nr:hypothetical protein [uncultured Prevotella sp.]MDU6554890.1 hypothetical protein [Prevotella bivia]
MKLPIDKLRYVTLSLCCFGIIESKAQVAIAETNPLEYTAIISGEELINKNISKQNTGLAKMNVKLGGIYLADRKMRAWEEKYNNYLVKAGKYVSQLRAGSMLYLQGIEILRSVIDLRKAIRDNPQGVVSAGFIRNIYVEVGTEFLRTFGIMKDIVSKKGEGNMINGSERVQYMWDLTRSMDNLLRKLNQLTVYVSVCNFEDVWNRAIRGKVNKSNYQLATEAHRRMNKAVLSVARRIRGRY